MSKYKIKAKNNFVGIWEGDTELAYWSAKDLKAFDKAKAFRNELEAANIRRDDKGRFIGSKQVNNV